MRLVFDHLAEPMFVHDAAGRILDANRAACAQIGYERAELVGMHVSDIEIVGSKGIFAAWDRVARGERVSAETMQKRKDGSLVPVRVTMSRLAAAPLIILAVAVPARERS